MAVLGTIFFSVLRHAGLANALRHALWWEVGLMVAMLVISPLLPRQVRSTQPASAPVAAADERVTA